MKKNCTQCRQDFEISDTDLAFYDRISPVIGGKKQQIPPPTLCPACRRQRRLAFRNERKLYHRKCDLSGKQMISMHPADSPFQVYHITEWLGDKWDARDHGRDFDFSRPFFDQFKELCAEVPHFNAFVDPSMDVNSEYTNCSSEAKNCYMITQAEKNEDCYHSRGINNSKNCCDCLRIDHCELCYECISASQCYRCIECEDCDNCSDCYFSSELRGCKNCFGCHGLTRKEYHIFNEPVTPEEWDKKVKKLLLTRPVVEAMRKRSAEERLRHPQRASHVLQSENCTGDHLTNCRESHDVFDSRDLEHCAYCYEVLNGAKDAYDFSMFGLHCELLYECNGCGYNVHNVLFSNHCWNNVSDLLYCESCFPSVKHCFGCFGLKRAEYCILNKQYSKEEYEKLVPKLIEHMRKTGEWGEFFPITMSAYGYNESLAGEFFTLSEKEATSRGWPWRDEPEETEKYLGPGGTPPESIDKASEDLCEHIFRCAATDKPYKIIPQEYAFYRATGVPPPAFCPEERHKRRMGRRNPSVLYPRACAKCKAAVQTTIAPDRPETVWCESCYLSSIS